jgi:hypothetical protein
MDGRTLIALMENSVERFADEIYLMEKRGTGTRGPPIGTPGSRSSGSRLGSWPWASRRAIGSPW